MKIYYILGSILVIFCSIELTAMEINQGGRLHEAARSDNAEDLKRLLLSDADINNPCGSQRTPLQEALFHGSLQAAIILLEHGAHVARNVIQDGRLVAEGDEALFVSGSERKKRTLTLENEKEYREMCLIVQQRLLQAVQNQQEVQNIIMLNQNAIEEEDDDLSDYIDEPGSRINYTVGQNSIGPSRYDMRLLVTDTETTNQFIYDGKQT